MVLSLTLLLATAGLPDTTLSELLSTQDDRRARELATGLADQPVPADLSQRLHAALDRPTHPPGTAVLRVAVDEGVERVVALRVPQGYDPARAWPLLLVWHWSGGTAAEALAAAEAQLGTGVEDWVVAAPHDYRQTGLDAPPPFLDEHRRTLHALRETFHLDADRTVGLGWSLGGYTAWAWALLHGEELAAAIAVAATTSTPPDDSGLWDAVAHNGSAVPVLTVWGSGDRLSVAGLAGERAGSVLELNRELRDRLGADTRFSRWHWVEVKGEGHGVFRVDDPVLGPWLERRREPSPSQVERRFRHLHQGSVWWLAAMSLGEPLWGRELPKPTRQKGESRLAAIGREVVGRLARVEGSRASDSDGIEQIRISTHLVEGLAVRFECRDLVAPRMVAIQVDGAEVFRGPVAPSLPLALLEARRTLDFERLTCAMVARNRRGGPWAVVAP